MHSIRVSQRCMPVSVLEAAGFSALPFHSTIAQSANAISTSKLRQGNYCWDFYSAVLEVSSVPSTKFCSSNFCPMFEDAVVSPVSKKSKKWLWFVFSFLNDSANAESFQKCISVQVFSCGPKFFSFVKFSHNWNNMAVQHTSILPCLSHGAF